MGIQAAGLRHHPKPHRLGPPVEGRTVLAPECCLRLSEGGAKGGDAGDRDGGGLQLAHSLDQRSCAATKFFGAEFIRACGGPADQVRDPDAA